MQIDGEMAVEWPQVIKVWWLVVWRGLAMGMVAGFVAGLVIGFTVAVSGGDAASVQSVSTAFGGLFGLGAALLAMRMGMQKQYQGFRLAIVRTE